MTSDSEVRHPRVIMVAGATLGALLLAASAAIHVDLYATGYDRIPTIGPLFLLQAAADTVLAISGLTATKWIASPMRPWVVRLWAAAALFALGTIVGYAISRTAGLFGFHEVPTTAGLLAGLVEAGAFVAYAGLVLATARIGDRWSDPRPKRRARKTQFAVVAIVAAALLAVALMEGIGTGVPRGGAATTSATHAKKPMSHAAAVVHVVISDYAYQPARVVAHPGEVIAVTNHDQVTHTMTAIPGSTPYGGFNTGYVDPGRTVRIHAPQKPGTYRFYCSIHNFMKGVLVVRK